MSIVYEGLHRVTKRRVAVKIIDSDRRRAFRFLREARAASAIGHPGIVDVLDAGTDEDGTPYLVLELLEGESLGSAVAARTVSWAEVVSLVAQVLDALDAAHARGIVHRDVKPENIHLVQDGEVRRAKLLDFGVAKMLEPRASRRTADGAVVGTPSYMAPEQARGGELDGRADIWSVGAVLYEAFSGAPPFERGNGAETMAALLTQPVPRVAAAAPDLPPWLAEVVQKALARDPDDRWSTARDMAAALLEGLATKGGVPEERSCKVDQRSVETFVVPRDVEVTPPESSPVSRLRRHGPWVLGAVAVSAAAFLAVELTRPSEDETPPPPTAVEPEVAAPSPGPPDRVAVPNESAPEGAPAEEGEAHAAQDEALRAPAEPSGEASAEEEASEEPAVMRRPRRTVRRAVRPAPPSAEERSPETVERPTPPAPEPARGSAAPQPLMEYE